MENLYKILRWEKGNSCIFFCFWLQLLQELLQVTMEINNESSQKLQQSRQETPGVLHFSVVQCLLAQDNVTFFSVHSALMMIVVLCHYSSSSPFLSSRLFDTLVGSSLSQVTFSWNNECVCCLDGYTYWCKLLSLWKLERLALSYRNWKMVVRILRPL